MSFDAERRLIATFIAQTQSDFGLGEVELFGDGLDLSTSQFNRGSVSIVSGQAALASFGAPGANLRYNPGVLFFRLFTDGALGWAGASAKADEIVNAFTGRRIDQLGGNPTATSTLIVDFAHNDFQPFVAAKEIRTPYFETTIQAPFVRKQRI